MMRAFAAAVLCVVAHPAAAEVWRDGDRLLDADPTAGCRAAHAAGAAGALVACPRHARVTADRIELFTPIYFDHDKATLRPVSFPVLDEVAGLLAAHPALRIEVQGHGPQDPDRAMRITDRRAQAVLQYLVHRGIAPERLESNGYGDNVPLVLPSAPDAARNRRIELRIIGP